MVRNAPASARSRPMEALSVDEIPVGREWQYEPKWDGFRCLVFRDGDTVELQSKSGKPLTRYFPDWSRRCGRSRPRRFVLDGEIVVPRRQGVLVRRAAAAHPSGGEPRAEAGEGNAGAADRVRPAGRWRRHVADRRCRCTSGASGWKRFARRIFRESGSVRLSPATTKLADAKKWLKQVGATLDGIIAKRRDLPYRVRRPHAACRRSRTTAGRLRGRRLPLQRRQAGGRLAAARALRRRRPAQSRRLHLVDRSARKSRR